MAKNSWCPVSRPGRRIPGHVCTHGSRPSSSATRTGRPSPLPRALGFTPGQLLGSVSGELGLRKFLESQGHTLVVTADKDGPDSVLERELGDAEVVISQPFWPAYMTAERIAKAKKLKLPSPPASARTTLTCRRQSRTR